MKWISVKEELPKRDRNILLAGKFSQMETGYCSLETDIFHSDSGELEHDEVTHWQPLPEPPEEE